MSSSPKAVVTTPPASNPVVTDSPSTSNNVKTSPAMSGNQSHHSSPAMMEQPQQQQEEIHVDEAQQMEQIQNASTTSSSSSKRLKFTPLVSMLFFITLLVVAFGVTQIVIATTKDGLKVRHTWAILVNGIMCCITGLVGLFTCFFPTVRSFKVNGILNFLTFIEAIVLYIVYCCLVKDYISDDCGGNMTWDPFCHELKLYLGVSLGVFWSFNLFLLPMSLLTSIALVKESSSEKENEQQ